MQDEDKSKEHLINELNALRQQVAELTTSETEYMREVGLVQGRREYAENIVATVREPLIVLNVDLTVDSANRSFYHTFQVTPSEIKGQLLYDLGNGQWNIPRLREVLEKILPEKSVFNDFEVEFAFPILGRRVMLLNARQVYNTRHEPQFILLAIEDVTERKQVEENIRALNAELETRVQQRTAELELVNQDLKHFIYAASHDLKTPLRGVSQIAYWLVEDYGDVFDTHGKEMLALQIDRVKRAYDLLDGILEYSSIGHALEEKACVPLQPLVMDVIQMLAPSEGIHIEIEHALPVIAGERKSLKKVFYHLLKNAIHVVDDTDGEITIRYADEKTHWKFDIVDNGPGIDEKYHEKIFQFFQTVDAHTGQRGLGIGLALVKKIIQLHGGEIGVTSMVGQGCEFSFTLAK